MPEEFEDEDMTQTSHYKFDKWVASRKTHKCDLILMTFLEFEFHFAQLLEQDQRLVGMNKVLLFLKYVDQEERMKFDIQLEDNDVANHLIKDWEDVRRRCHNYERI